MFRTTGYAPTMWHWITIATVTIYPPFDHGYQVWLGAEDDLNTWHSIYRAIRIEPLPATCTRSKKVRTHLASLILHEYSRCQI